MAVDIDIAAPHAHELNFVRDSWRRSFQEAPANASMPSSAYTAWANQFMRALIGDDDHVFRMAPGCHMLVARDKDRPAFCYGWLLYHVEGDALNVIYAFTKGKDSAWKRQRVAGRLIAAAMEKHDVDPERMHYGTRTRFDDIWLRRGWTFKPFQSVIERAK